MDEYSAVERYIRPLLHGGTFVSNRDDAAQVLFSDHSLIITKDLLVEGVHFLSGGNPKLLAKKALRVNLSDLASMGATPHSYLLGLSLPKGITNEWWREFAEGLREDNEHFSINLVGGDTTSNSSGIVIISITAIGIPGNKVLTRCKAQEGDYIYVSGTIGDAALGLMAYKNKIPGGCTYLKYRYDLPIPRVQLAASIYTLASSCIDISDGLLQDIKTVCQISQTGAVINSMDIPLSEEARRAVMLNSTLLENIVTGGDDYELAFTVPPENCKQVEKIAAEQGVSISKIGLMTSEPEVRILDERGNEVTTLKQGYIHTF